MNKYTPKQRMLNAYKGVYSDYYPIAPEFWFFYPAKVLGISVMEFQRDVPHWRGLLETFRKFNADGWGIAGANEYNPHVKIQSEFRKIMDEKYRETQKVICNGKELERSFIFYSKNPSWVESFAVKNESDLKVYMDAFLSEDINYDFSNAREAYKVVGEDFLLEFDLGLPFFDFFEGAMGFENAIMFFVDSEEKVLQKFFDRYLNNKKKLLREAVENTSYESYFIGCSSSCNSLLGANLWGKWDKPYLKAITEEVHKYGKLIHHHNHGKIMQTIRNLVEIGFDCVCPFERSPGDVNGLEGLKAVREMLENKVTFNGNVHTIEALGKVTPEFVISQVREIKEAFKGTPRLIIGTGDQVLYETPEENIYAMIEEGRK